MSCRDPRVGWCLDIKACPDCTRRMSEQQARMKALAAERFEKLQSRIDLALAPLLESKVVDVNVSYLLGRLESVTLVLEDGNEVKFDVAGDMYDFSLSVDEVSHHDF